MTSEWETKAAISSVINGYSGAAGRLDIAAFTDFFHADAEVHGVAGLLGQPEPLKGSAQIAGFFGASFDNLEWLIQMNTTTDIAVSTDGKRATSSTGLVERAKRKGAGAIMLVARYDDELVLTDNGWKFARRRLTPLHFQAL